MSVPRWTLALALVAGVLLAGCAQVEDPREGDPAVGDSDERLAVDPLTPEGTQVTADVGDTVTFVVECQPPGLPEEVVVEWEHAVRGEGVEDSHQDFQSSDEPSAFTVTFEEEAEHVVTAVCTTADDRTVPHLWNITVGASPSDDAFGTPTDGNLTVHVVDVGQGDGIVLHLPNHTIVYDTGRWHGDSETAVRDHLLAEEADPDALVVSHPDADHAGGCEGLLDAFEVEHLYHPGLEKDTQTWQACEAAMRAEGAPIRTGEDLEIGQALPGLEEAGLQLLHVDASRTDDPNEGSIVLEVTHGSFEMVLTGDIGCDTEDALVHRGLVGDVDVVQVAHHGSSYSTCHPWLEATDPEAGVLSVGDNDYGHPAEDTLDRLAAHGAEVFRTDVHGTIAVTTNGTAWSIASAEGPGAGGEATDDVEEALNVTATVDDPEPCQSTDVTVSITATGPNGTPVEDANTTSTWHYASSTPSEAGATNATGEDAHTRYISGAEAGREVRVDVEVDASRARGSASARFTPQAC